MVYRDYLTLKPLLFGALDFVTDCEDGSVLLVPRSSSLDAGSLSFIAEAAEYPTIERVYVAVRSPDIFSNVRSSIEHRLQQLDVEIQVVETDSYAFVTALSKSQLLFLMNHYSIPNYRLFSRRTKRDVIRVHHGILTKAYGNLTAENLQRQSRRRQNKIGYPNRQKYITNVNIDVQSVESDVEVFYRSAAEGRSPSVFKRYGYPRFDRLGRLLAGDVEPILPTSTAKRLDESTAHRVLYAPTHKDETYNTTLFPFSSFELNRLQEFLRRNGIELYVRMHINEEDDQFYDEVIDNETIFYAGQGFSPSPTEILPFFDTLITDYSSIYLDYLPVDNPIIFVKDDHETFLQHRGIAFDYNNYFPGRKIETFETFMSHLSTCVEEGSDGHADDREFVRRTFLPDRDQTFFEHVIEQHLDQL